MQTMDTSSPILSVGALNRAIAQSLTEGFDTVLVSGEISNFKAYDSGHWYFSLKDEEGQIRCVMFRGKNAQLGFMPQSGDQVEACMSQEGTYSSPSILYARLA
jgi:exodeoxyribonuclease VII large subunit